MLRSEIDTVLKETPSWLAADETTKNQFAERMYARSYDWDALTQAWGWYLCGASAGKPDVKSNLQLRRDALSAYIRNLSAGLLRAYILETIDCASAERIDEFVTTFHAQSAVPAKQND